MCLGVDKLELKLHSLKQFHQLLQDAQDDEHQQAVDEIDGKEKTD